MQVTKIIHVTREMCVAFENETEEDIDADFVMAKIMGTKFQSRPHAAAPQMLVKHRQYKLWLPSFDVVTLHACAL